MHRIFVILFLLTATAVLGQDARQEINNQVWKPFIKSFNERDTKGFMSIHSKDVIRSPRDAKTILNWEEYNRQMSRGDQQEKNSPTKRQIELRFTERIAGKDKAIDVGVYKTSYIQADGNTRSSFARFHVVMHKESGVWKILVDMDSSENHTIDENNFLAAAPME